MLFFGLCFIILLLSIFLGVRLGGLGVAYASGIGLFIYTMVLGIPPGNIPIDVVFIIIAVIGMIAVLELSGGLIYLVHLAEIILKKHPKQINYLAPLVTFFMTVLAGTGHTAYSIMPVIIEVAKSQGIRPVYPLTLASVASQVGVIASPISAAFVAFMVILSPFGVTSVIVLAIIIPAGVVACLMTSAIISFFPQKLATDANYQRLLKEGKVKEISQEKREIPDKARIAVFIFLVTVLSIALYSIFPVFKPIYANGTQIRTAFLIVILMLFGAYVMTVATKIDISKLPMQSTFRAGMSAVLCVLGVAWLGDTIIGYYNEDIKIVIGDFLLDHPWSFAVVLFFLSSLLYSQAVTTVAIMPLGVTLGLAPEVLIGSFGAVCALFLLPTYPTVIAAVQMDDTSTTKIGKYIFNHSFIIPGTLMLVFTCFVSYILACILI